MKKTASTISTTCTPNSKKKAGRPLKTSFEDLHKQKLILSAIEQGAGKSPAELEKIFNVGSADNGNAGKAWRRWANGSTACNQLEVIIKIALEKNVGNLKDDPKTKALITYMERKQKASQDRLRRRNNFTRAQATLSKALAEFRSICEHEHNRSHVTAVMPPLEIVLGDDEDSYSSFPLDGHALEDLFNGAEQLNRLELTFNADPPIEDPQAKGFSFGFEYRKKPA